MEEGRDYLQPLQGAGFALPLTGTDHLAQRLGLGFQVEAGQPGLDRLGTHRAAEVLPEPVLHLPVEDLVTFQVLHLEALEPGPDRLQPIQLALGPVPDQLDLLLGAVTDLLLDVRLSALGLELVEVLFQFHHPDIDVVVAASGKMLALDLDLALQGRQVAVTGLLIDLGDHVRREVDDLLEVLRRDVEQVAKPGRDALEIPDVGNRGGQLDVAHPLPPDIGPGDLDAAALADDSLEPDPLVLTAVAFPVPGRTKDLLAEQTVALRFQSPVVDGLRLLDLAV